MNLSNISFIFMLLCCIVLYIKLTINHVKAKKLNDKMMGELCTKLTFEPKLNVVVDRIVNNIEVWMAREVLLRILRTSMAGIGGVVAGVVVILVTINDPISLWWSAIPLLMSLNMCNTYRTLVENFIEPHTKMVKLLEGLCELVDYNQNKDSDDKQSYDEILEFFENEETWDDFINPLSTIKVNITHGDV